MKDGAVLGVDRLSSPVVQKHDTCFAVKIVSAQQGHTAIRRFGMILAFFSSFVFNVGIYAQSALQARIAAVSAEAQGTVSVSCLLPGTALNCDLHPHNHSPMQSVFKFPLALTVLHLADTGKLLSNQRPGEPISVTLDRTVRFLPQDRIPHTWSPLQDRYPEANVDVPLRELIELTVGQSDNSASEVLLRIVGGPSVVQDYMRSLGIAEFQLQDGEQGLYRDRAAQYRNWMSAGAAVQLFERLASNSPLSGAANEFLMQTLTASTTGPTRLRAGLPAGTALAHKTGTSGEHEGIAEATNDIGLITLSDGRRLAIAVFVTDARANEAARDSVIARIGRAVYDEALHRFTNTAWQPAPGHTQLPLWPGVVFGAQPVSGPESVATENSSLVAGRPWLYVSNVSLPTMTVYSPQGKNTGAAVIVFPGGGYQILAIDLEGTEVCDWLTSRGITCVLLKYHVPGEAGYLKPAPYPKSGPYPESPLALEDAQRGLRLVRFHAAEWHIDPHKIGVLGFSAGGHLSAAISTHFERRLYAAVDAADNESCRPDFAVAIYPGHLSISAAEWDAKQGARKFVLHYPATADRDLGLNPDIPVTRHTPPTFLLQAEDDHADNVNDSLAYYIALKNAGVPVEMHLYAQGGHAFGLRRTKFPITGWPQLVEARLVTIGITAR